MGSPLFPLFADIVMDDMEIDCLLTLKNNFDCTPLVYFRYVDILLCIKNEHLNTVLDVFNNYNPHLSFSRELEQNNSINFLYITITR